jgi:argininosuccinate lyase
VTGRLTAAPGARVRRIVYGGQSAADIADELALSTTMDQAHVVMLAECGLVPVADAARILDHIEALRRRDFADLHGVAMPRGLYLAYEDHLVAALGPDTGGRLHTGRSRNDMKATATTLRLRTGLTDLAAELVRLQAILASRARAHRRTVLPVHTHFQAALPISYGYYLLGVAIALGRDIEALRGCVAALRCCPLGAGAAAGTDLPIDPARVAALLGFAEPVRHALDAVASRDVALRAVAVAASAALTISRLATDLQLWSSAEFGYLRFPDRLVGGSSAMPQKRNAFLLEHLKAKAGAAIGAWTAAASTTRATPFTNSIEVGTEAVAAIWPGLRAVDDAAQLAQLVVSGARPDEARMVSAAEHGFVGATALANQLVREGMPFRAAHTAIGSAVRAAVERGATGLAPHDLPAALHSTDTRVTALLARQAYGGGPGQFDTIFDSVHRELVVHSGWCEAERAARLRARQALDAAVQAIRRGEASGRVV